METTNRLLSPEEQLHELYTPEDEWKDSKLAREVREFVSGNPSFPTPFAVIQPVDGPSIFLHPHSNTELAQECIEHDAVEAVLVLEVVMTVEKHGRDKSDFVNRDDATAASPSMQFIKELELEGIHGNEVMEKAKAELGMKDRILVSRHTPGQTVDWFWVAEESEWMYSESMQGQPNDDRNPFYIASRAMAYATGQTLGKTREWMMTDIVKCYRESKAQGRGWNTDNPLNFFGLNQMIAVVEEQLYRLTGAITSNDLMELNACQKLYRTTHTDIAGGIGMFQELLDDDRAFHKTLRSYSSQGRDRIRESLTGRVDRLSQLLAKVKREYEKHGSASNN